MSDPNLPPITALPHPPSWRVLLLNSFSIRLLLFSGWDTCTRTTAPFNSFRTQSHRPTVSLLASLPLRARLSPSIRTDVSPPLAPSVPLLGLLQPDRPRDRRRQDLSVRHRLLGRERARWCSLCVPSRSLPPQLRPLRLLTPIATLLVRTTDQIHVLPSLGDKPPPSKELPDLHTPRDRDPFVAPFPLEEYVAELEHYHVFVRSLLPFCISNLQD